MVIVMVNLLLLPFGVRLITITNLTDEEYLFVTLRAPEIANLFMESMEWSDWDLFVVRRMERQVFSVNAWGESKGEYMINGIPVIVRTSSLLSYFRPGSVVITSKDVSDDLEDGKSVNKVKLTFSTCGLTINSSTQSVIEEMLKHQPHTSTINADETKIQSPTTWTLDYLLNKKNLKDHVYEDEFDMLKKFKEASIDHCQLMQAIMAAHGRNCHHFFDDNADIQPTNNICEITVETQYFHEIADVAFALKFKLDEDDMLVKSSSSKKNGGGISGSSKVPKNNKWFSVSTTILNHLNNEKSNIMEHIVTKLLDAYNEYFLLIVEAVQSDQNLTNVIVLAVASITISVINGGSSIPKTIPGKGWWGSGKQLSDDDKLMKGGDYVDAMLRAQTSTVLSALLSIAVLGIPRTGNAFAIEDAINFATSQAYLACFSFALLCVCENTFREDDKPLSALRKDWGMLGYSLKVLCQLLCACIPIAINVIVYYSPSSYIVPILGFLVTYGGFFITFKAEPTMLMYNWSHSNLATITNTIAYMFQHGFYHLTYHRLRLQEVDILKVVRDALWKDYINHVLYIIIFAGAFVGAIIVSQVY